MRSGNFENDKGRLGAAFKRLLEAKEYRRVGDESKEGKGE